MISNSVNKSILTGMLALVFVGSVTFSGEKRADDATTKQQILRIQIKSLIESIKQDIFLGHDYGENKKRINKIKKLTKRLLSKEAANTVIKPLDEMLKCKRKLTSRDSAKVQDWNWTDDVLAVVLGGYRRSNLLDEKCAKPYHDLAMSNLSAAVSENEKQCPECQIEVDGKGTPLTDPEALPAASGSNK